MSAFVFSPSQAAAILISASPTRTLLAALLIYEGSRGFFDIIRGRNQLRVLISGCVAALQPSSTTTAVCLMAPSATQPLPPIYITKNNLLFSLPYSCRQDKRTLPLSSFSILFLGLSHCITIDTFREMLGKERTSRYSVEEHHKTMHGG